MNRQTKIPGYLTAYCSFCNSRGEGRKKFVEGPGVRICDSCIALCAKVLSKTLKGVEGPKYIPGRKPKREIVLCSFCGKHEEEVQAFFSRRGLRICDACVKLSAEALSRQPKRALVHRPNTWCGFCGQHPEKGEHVVAGPGVYICDACVTVGTEVIAEELKRAQIPKGNPDPKRPSPPVRKNVLCSFCGKHRQEVRALIDGQGVYICDSCVDLSEKLVAGTRVRAAGMKLTTIRS